MSDSPSVAATADSSVLTTERVDSALRQWRTETHRRRNAWAMGHADFVADQQARRERLTVFVAAASFAFVSTLVVSTWAWSQWNQVAVPALPETTVAVVPEFVPTSEFIEPQRRTMPARPPASAASLGVSGTIYDWQDNGTLWIQVDYAGDTRELRWLDANGEEALERSPCTNRIGAGLKRCFVGRTATRVQRALQAGHAPGTWVAQLCDGDTCATVAKYAVGL